MASASIRTPKLIPLEPGAPSSVRVEQICIPPSGRLTRFLDAAAQAGLDAPLAVQLALERAVVLKDGRDLRLDVERIRRTLGREARRARAARQLSGRQATYVRMLYREKPRQPCPAAGGLSVVIPDELLTQIRDTIPETVLHPRAVPEMLAWERAARLEGRTMLEWSLKVLARLFVAR
ncbi:MAG TPA: hypothetical protein VMF09_04965 [Solirubrobacteraceae bacterium]|nr:hypothetical protein [Solirubrobacteraceae bacterium]